MQPFPSRRYVLPSCTLERLKRPECVALAATLVTMDPWRTLEYRPEALGAYLSRSDSTFFRFTIRVAGDPAGLVALRYPLLRGIYLELLAVFPPYQGLGLGREIMSFVEAQVRPHTQNFWTAVSAFNHRARLFYQNLGFLEVARLENLIKEGCDELLLRKIMA
jgi:ribosomal protein S18 acetylase RimI-like enzyme